jgi:hypothetical protein
MKNLKYQLQNCNLSQVFFHLRDKHAETDSNPESVKINDIIFTYMKMIYELIDKIDAADLDDQYTLYVDLVTSDNDPFTDEDYIDVKVLNGKFIERPPTDKSPWGGDSDNKDDHPDDDYYNVNWDGYQEFFAISGTDREKYLLRDIIVTNGVRPFITQEEYLETGKTIFEDEVDDYIVAEILWELSFYGIMEEKCKNVWDNIKKDVDNIKKDEYLTEHE